MTTRRRTSVRAGALCMDKGVLINELLLTMAPKEAPPPPSMAPPPERKMSLVHRFSRTMSLVNMKNPRFNSPRMSGMKFSNLGSPFSPRGAVAKRDMKQFAEPPNPEALGDRPAISTGGAEKEEEVKRCCVVS